MSKRFFVVNKPYREVAPPHRTLTPVKRIAGDSGQEEIWYSCGQDCEACADSEFGAGHRMLSEWWPRHARKME